MKDDPRDPLRDCVSCVGVFAMEPVKDRPQEMMHMHVVIAQPSGRPTLVLVLDDPCRSDQRLVIGAITPDALPSMGAAITTYCQRRIV